MAVNGEQFLEALWTASPPGYILLWNLADRRSRYLKSGAAVASALGESDIYTGVGLAHANHGVRKRTTNDQIVAIPGLWADIDVNGGADEKTGACASWDQAYEVAQALVAPTILVGSGNGLQAWWLFEEPWRFETYGEQRQAALAAVQWQALLRRAAGVGMDATHDLARVLRLPGTWNCKRGGRKPVAVIEEGPRHQRDDLLQLAGEAGAVTPGVELVADRKPILFSVPGASWELVAELRQRSPSFNRTWRHEREFQSMSEYDLSLASMAALCGCSDREIASVVVTHRDRYNDHKGRRLDYLRRTVARARKGR